MKDGQHLTLFAAMCSGMVVLGGCDSAEETISPFDRFAACARESTGDTEINRGIHESCLRRFESVTESYLGRDVEAQPYPPGHLRVEYTNLLPSVVTSIEVEIFWPDRKDVNCNQNIGECRSMFVSGRTWILPNERGAALIRLPGEVDLSEYVLPAESGEAPAHIPGAVPQKVALPAIVLPASAPAWTFKVQSVRYLAMEPSSKGGT